MERAGIEIVNLLVDHRGTECDAGIP